MKTKRRCFGILIKMPFENIVERHQETLLSRHKEKCRSIPFLHYLVTEEIVQRLERAETSLAEIIEAITATKWSPEDEDTLKSIKVPQH